MYPWLRIAYVPSSIVVGRRGSCGNLSSPMGWQSRILLGIIAVNGVDYHTTGLINLKELVGEIRCIGRALEVLWKVLRGPDEIIY